MPATKISDLLPIPEEAKTPHAYQVFGLEGGEQDSAKIKRAVQEVYRRLKEAKADTDPELWRKAAKLVEKARSILGDPEKRAALDARFGVIAFDDAFADNDASPPADFLAEFLPTTDPLASDPLGGVVPTGDPMALTAPSQPTAGMAPVGIAPMAPNPMATPVPQPVGTAIQDLPVASPTPVTSTPRKQPVAWKPKKSSKRRRKSVLGTAIFVMFLLCMFGIIGGLLFVMSKHGRISITASQENESPPGKSPSTRTRAPVVNRDPVLASVPSSGRVRPADSLTGSKVMSNPNAMPGQMTKPSPPTRQPPPMEKPVTETPKPVTETPKPVETTQAKPETEPTPEMVPESSGSERVLPVESGEQESPAKEMTDEMIAAADAAIAKVETLIQQPDWNQMKPAADKVTEMTLTDKQRKYAIALYNLADLATYYRVGIGKGIGTLQTASTFEYTEGVSVLVVETSANAITIRRGARNYSYTLDDMPFRLAERLCAFALSPDKPDSIAARSCFQSIAPKSNADYRKDAISWLEFVNDDVEGVDTKEVAKAVKKLFPG